MFSFRRHAKTTERESLAPVYDSEELTAAGTIIKTFSFPPRAVMIVIPWTAAEDLQVLYVGDATNWKTISEAAIKAMGAGAIYPFAIQSFRSSGAGETSFTLMACQ